MALLEIRNLVKKFPVRRGFFNRVVGHVHAVNDVSFTVEAGQKVGLVGESGCGKLTLGKTLARLWEPTSGSIRYKNVEISKFSDAAMLPYRKEIQFIFQDPYGSLNPKMTVFSTLIEPYKVHNLVSNSREEQRKLIADLLETVGLPADSIDKYPHEFSGGQRQRIGIARAIATQPELIIADEPVSALDVSVQAQIVNLLDKLRDDQEVAFLFISHDLKVVHHFCEEIIVMYLGHIVEILSSEALYEDASHPYTKALLSAIPVDDPFNRVERQLLEGDVPSPIELPTGCPFHTRCPLAVQECREHKPSLRTISSGHHVACHFVEGEQATKIDIGAYDDEKVHKKAHKELSLAVEADAEEKALQVEIVEESGRAMGWGIAALFHVILSPYLLQSFPALGWLLYPMLLFPVMAIWKGLLTHDLVKARNTGEDWLPQANWSMGIGWACLISWTSEMMGLGHLWSLLGHLFGAL